MSWRTSPPANRRCCCVVWCVVIANRRRSWARLKGKVHQRRIHLSLCFCFYHRRLTRLLCVRSTAACCCELLTTERCATGCAPLTLRLPEHRVSGALTAKVKGLKPHSDIFHCVFQVKVFTEMSRMDEEESWMLQHNLRQDGPLCPRGCLFKAIISVWLREDSRAATSPTALSKKKMYKEENSTRK